MWFCFRFCQTEVKAAVSSRHLKHELLSVVTVITRCASVAVTNVHVTVWDFLTSEWNPGVSWKLVRDKTLPAASQVLMPSCLCLGENWLWLWSLLSLFMPLLLPSWILTGSCHSLSQVHSADTIVFCPENSGHFLSSSTSLSSRRCSTNEPKEKLYRTKWDKSQDADNDLELEIWHYLIVLSLLIFL